MGRPCARVMRTSDVRPISPRLDVAQLRGESEGLRKWRILDTQAIVTTPNLLRLARAAIIIVFLAARGIASEALHFERLACDLRPSDTDLAGVATFPFVNVSPVPVTIMMVRASCPCVKPRLEKITYHPGEHGEVVVDAVFGSMTGVQRRRLEIVSDHIASRSTIIEVVMHLPPGPQFDPSSSIGNWGAARNQDHRNCISQLIFCTISSRHRHLNPMSPRSLCRPSSG